MLSHRRRQWTNIQTTLFQFMLFAGKKTGHIMYNNNYVMTQQTRDVEPIQH